MLYLKLILKVYCELIHQPREESELQAPKMNHQNISLYMYM